jgi:hypothetical protein
MQKPVQQKKRYVQPVLEKQHRLEEVTEGGIPSLTSGSGMVVTP